MAAHQGPINRVFNLFPGRMNVVLLLGVFLLIYLPPTEASQNKTCDEDIKCRPGIFLPLWEPTIENLSAGDKAARATVYFAAMIFMFLGVSIIADRFMAAIEVITSKEREVTVRKPNGETQIVNVRIWNETVSNLTLMALGSSAPEILLSIIEIIGNKFEAGDLGPGTIVGSAAFNLFIITALCVSVIPDGEVRRIKHLRVFFITASWSVFAYLWMYIIISVITPGVINVWEGVLTFLFFPATVVTAYIADKKIFFYRFLRKRYRTSRNKTVVVSENGTDMELGDKVNHMGEEMAFKGLDSEDVEIREFEKHRKDYIEILRELRKKHPNLDMKTLEEMAEYEAMNRGPKSRAFYRIQATRKLTGGGNVIKKSKIERRSSLQDVKVEVLDDSVTRILFEPGHYTVMENVGTFMLTVSRVGGNCSETIYVDYVTEDGTANAGSDYEYAEGTLIFYPGETHKQFPVTIIDDDVFEEDEHFYVRLQNLRFGDTNGTYSADYDDSKLQLANPSMATVMILDDDHAGIVHFETAETSVSEAIGEAQFKLIRSSGARGRIMVPFRTLDGSAKGGKDFEMTEGDVIFENDETEAYIKVRIMDDEEYEKTEVFFITLGEPQLVRRGSAPRKSVFGLMKKGKKPEPVELPNSEEEKRIAEMGRPRLGDIIKLTVNIRESLEFKSTVDKLLKKANMSLVVGTSSWREQFIEAITVSSGEDNDDDDGEDSEEKLPSCMDYVMHFLTIFWKVLFAFVPPTDYGGGWFAFWSSILAIGILTALIGDLASAFGCTVGLLDAVTAVSFVALGTSVPDYWGGWACFMVSIIMIGVLTALIGDLASSFGCTVGLQDAVTAISFVALGTSVPDTFASKVAAINDRYADSSIGNVTGSNAVNVFLGIGVAWTIAAVKHAIYGTTFEVKAGSLAFSVTIFCVFAGVAILVLILRRAPVIGGELGGPKLPKILTSMIFCSLWVMYLLLSALETYCHIKGF